LSRYVRDRRLYCVAAPELARRYGVSLDALYECLKRSTVSDYRTRWADGPATRYYTEAAVAWLEEPAYTVTQMADLWQLDWRMVDRVIKLSEIVWPAQELDVRNMRPKRLFSRACSLYVEYATGPIRAIPIRRATDVTVVYVRDALDISPDTLTVILREQRHLGIMLFEVREQPRALPKFAMTGAAFKRLQAWLPPYAEIGWYPVAQLEELTGWHMDTLRRHVARRQAEIREYRDSRGIVRDHFRLADIEDLGIKPKVSPAGDWLTIRGMARRLKRAQTWVRPRMPVHPGEDRLTTRGEIARHYPPEVFERLARISEAERAWAERQEAAS
jgi:hypothetical protein